ncbi:MAG: DnaA regulatory inactivator Hda [Rudaea sp.]|nr:DnaA regulatory inactivator Hda [Rudaea sp.]
MSSQLPLVLRWPAQQRFETWIAGDNAATLAQVRHVADTLDLAWVFVSGPPGCGKTHLLIAACALASERGRSPQYLALGKLPADRAAAIRAIGGSDLLALDDIGAIAGDREAEHALFDLYNRGKEEKSTLLFAATAPPAQLGIGLPDLVSRLSACTQAMLKPLGDAARREALRQRAQLRGLILDDTVLDWLFARTQRDLGSLTALIERLDRESLAAKRRITVPFLRKLLG